jgi:hypothetical protein
MLHMTLIWILINGIGYPRAAFHTLPECQAAAAQQFPGDKSMMCVQTTLSHVWVQP